MSAHGANFLNDWGNTLSNLLTPAYEYLFGGRIALKKNELDVINKKMVRSLSLFKSQGMPINVSCHVDGVRKIVVLEETKAGVKMSCNGKEIILKNIKSFENLYEVLKKEIDEIEDQKECDRISNSPYEIMSFNVTYYPAD
jgi:hypothetical protein